MNPQMAGRNVGRKDAVFVLAFGFENKVEEDVAECGGVWRLF